MSVITPENRNAWQQLADDLAVDRPSVGKTVTIVKGRKHNGETGTVVRHQISQFTGRDAYRYAGEAQRHFRDFEGRWGWVCLVEFSTGERAWINADYTEVHKPAQVDPEAQGSEEIYPCATEGPTEDTCRVCSVRSKCRFAN